MGAQPIVQEDLLNLGSNNINFIHGGDQGINQGDDFDYENLSEEEILRRVMEESLKLHEDEESKRSGTESNNNQQ
jgi:hypothetical protein